MEKPEKIEIIDAVFKQHKDFYVKSKGERARIYKQLGEEFTSVAASVDFASVQCAGFAADVAEGCLNGNPRTAIDDLKKIKILEDDEISLWLMRSGKEAPLYSAHIYCLAVLRQCLVAYYEVALVGSPAST